jgi:3-hydroxyacyl-[acyl-carrier-protein] dehydratase
MQDYPTMTFEVPRVIPADHPSLVGHFPGAPIVPAVVVLEEVAAALAEWRQGSQLTGISSVKFIGPIKPGKSFIVGFDSTNTAGNQIDFCCRLDGRVVVEGRLEISCGARI